MVHTAGRTVRVGVEIAVLALILLLGYLSGYNGGGNLMATLLGSRTLPRWVLFPLLTVSIAVGPVIFGTQVAATIGDEIVNLERVGPEVLAAALVAAAAAILVAWRSRVPTSTSVALVGGLVGGALVHGGPAAVHWPGVIKALLSLVLSLVSGFTVGFLVFRAVRWSLRGASPRVGNAVARGQYLTAALQGVGYGANDAEKTMGLLAALAVLSGVSHRFQVTWPMIALTVATFVAGMGVGGWRVARSIGMHVFRLRPVHGLSVQLAAAATVMTAAALGGPVSTTETTDAALLGVGTAQRPSMLRWAVVRSLLLVWGVTMPLALAVGMIVSFILGRV